KFRTLPTQGPSRGLPATGFMRLRLSFLILASPPDASIAPSMSFTTFDRSRILPSSPIMPGFSRPAAPYRTSFIATLLGIFCEDGRDSSRIGADHASPAHQRQEGRRRATRGA